MRCVGADDVPQRMDLFVRRPALLLLVNRYFRVKRSTTCCAELRFWRDHDLQNGPRDVCFQAEAKCAATADMGALSGRSLELRKLNRRVQPNYERGCTRSYLSVLRAFQCILNVHAKILHSGLAGYIRAG